MAEAKGAILTAFGARYVALAHQAAETLRATNPGLPVDLFTDAPQPPGPFARIHVLPQVWARAKIDSMLLSRFERTLFLDADLLVVADLGDVFDLLDRFDLAMAQDMYRASPKALGHYRRPFPNAFPQLNSGVMAFRRTPAVMAFLDGWKADVAAHGTGKDQPSLREALWDSDLRLAVLPPEYNLYDHHALDVMVPGRHAAPRVLHSHRLLGRPLPAPGQDAVAHYFGAATALKLRLMLAADETLAQREGRPARRPGRGEKLRLGGLYALYAAGWLAGRR